MNCKHTIQPPLPFKHKSQHGVHLTLAPLMLIKSGPRRKQFLFDVWSPDQKRDWLHPQDFLFHFVIIVADSLDQSVETFNSDRADQWPVVIIYTTCPVVAIFSSFLICVHDLAYGQPRFLQPSRSCEGIDFIWNGFLLLIFWIQQRVLGRLSTTKVFFSHCNFTTEPVLTFSLY